MVTLEIYKADKGDKLEQARQLWKEYGDFLKERLGEFSCRQEFVEYFCAYEHEINNDLPGEYGSEMGCLLVAEHEGEPAGAVGLRNLGDGVCEMKRLFISPKYRGLGIGRALAQVIVDHGRNMDYTSIRLNTNRRMPEAEKLYRSLGFKDFEPYEHFSIDGMVYLELKLK
jgi:putative acetyltransferase